MMFQTWEVQADSARGQRLAAAALERTGPIDPPPVVVTVDSSGVVRFNAEEVDRAQLLRAN